MTSVRRLQLASGRMKLLLGLASFLALAVLAAGCGGGGSNSSDSTKPPEEWADGVCSAINTWTDSLQSAAKSVTGGNLSENSLKQAASDLEDSTAQLKDDLDGLGKPDLASGDKAKQSVDTLSSNISNGVDKINGAIKDAQNGGGIVNAVTTVTSTIQTMGTQVQTTFNNLKSLDPAGELKSAFENASSCKSLSSPQG
jgi:hypothetical protein